MRSILLKWRPLAVAFAVLSLGALWFASRSDCRESGCGEKRAPGLAVEASGVPGMPSCPCPDSCEPEPAGGCTPACNRGRDSNSGRQPQHIRPGTADRLSATSAVDSAAETAPPAPPGQRWATYGPRSVSSTTAPLFIRNRSIIR